jgi:hypothetical protein
MAVAVLLLVVGGGAAADFLIRKTCRRRWWSFQIDRFFHFSWSKLSFVGEWRFGSELPVIFYLFVNQLTTKTLWFKSTHETNYPNWREWESGIWHLLGPNGGSFFPRRTKSHNPITHLRFSELVQFRTSKGNNNTVRRRTWKASIGLGQMPMFYCTSLVL